MDNTTVEDLKKELSELQAALADAVNKGRLAVAYDLEDQIEELQNQLKRLQS